MMDGIAKQQTQVSTPIDSGASQARVAQPQAKVEVAKVDNVVEDIQNASKAPTKINSKAELDNLVDDLNKAMAPMNTGIRFGVDTDDVFYVSVIESETSKMIRRFPAEKAADFLPKMQEVTGMLLDMKG